MRTADLFKAMGDQSRQQILQLTREQELTVGELVGCLRLPQSTVSRHLKVLRDAGLVRDRREGTTVRYAAAASGPNGAGVLAERLLGWIAEQELAPGLRQRLHEVLSHRQGGTEEFFSRVGRRWDQMRVEAFGDTFHLEALTTLLPSGWTVADIGTGTGYLLPVLARTFARVIAIDPVPRMLEVARARCRAAGLENVDFREGELAAVPLDDGAVNLAMAVLVVHHVPSPAEALAELRRILVPGGRLFVVEQAAHRLAAFHERMGDRWWGFEPSMLSALVSRAGFTDVRHRALAPGGTVDAPELFVLTATRPPDHRPPEE